MVRMSDILKRIGKGSEPESKKPREDKPAVPLEDKPSAPLREEDPSKEISAELEPKIEQQRSIDEGVRISKAMIHKEDLSKEEQGMSVSKAMRDTQLNHADSHRIYTHGLALMKKLSDKIQGNEPIELKEVHSLIEDIVERLVLGDSELLSLAVAATTENYLIVRSLNVAILSIEIGLGRGYNKSRLNELGLCAFLNQLGMVKVADITPQSSILSKDEYSAVKEHPLPGTEILARIKDINQSVLDVARKYREQPNGKVYLQGLNAEEIDEYSQIISLCDVYEALVHLRPHRIDSHDAIKEILSLNAEKYFEVDNVKILIKKLSIFPIGSWVELSTGEIGKVISANEDFPLRPNVNVVFGKDRQRYPEAKLIFLHRQQAIFIKRAVDLKDLGLKL